jgi:hypothetical protein
MAPCSLVENKIISWVIFTPKMAVTRSFETLVLNPYTTGTPSPKTVFIITPFAIRG